MSSPKSQADDAHYTDPRLTALYDHLNGWDAHREFYRALPGPAPQRVLDAGCGTGLIAARIAEAGHEVVGLDPAQAMLDIAARRPGGEGVEWRLGWLQDFTAERPFDVVFMSGHAFQCILDDDDLFKTFATARTLLAETGRFVFETRNPDAEPWLKWNPQTSRTVGETAAGDRYEMFHRVLNVSSGFVTFETTYLIGQAREEILSQSTLRFCTRGDIEGLAHKAGLRISELYGDWDGSTPSPICPELIFTLKRA